MNDKQEKSKVIPTENNARSNWRYACRITLLALLYFLIQPYGLQAASNDVQFKLTPAFWAAGVDIDTTTVKGRSISADVDFDDLFSNLDFGGMVHFEAWKGKWGLIIEEIYIDLGVDGRFQPRIGPALSADLDIRLNLFEVAVVHQSFVKQTDNLQQGPKGKTSSKFSIEPLGGLRWGVLKQEIDLKLTPARLASVGEPSRTIEGSDWWIELFVGGRMRYAFNERWTFLFRTDIGGIKAGDETVVSWNLFSGFDYKPWESTSVKVGYKVYDFNYENKESDTTFELDAIMHGPVLALTLMF